RDLGLAHSNCALAQTRNLHLAAADSLADRLRVPASALSDGVWTKDRVVERTCSGRCRHLTMLLTRCVASDQMEQSDPRGKVSYRLPMSHKPLKNRRIRHQKSVIGYCDWLGNCLKLLVSAC